MSEDSNRLKVIGYMKSPFLYKNGTPRQPIICRQVTGEITIEKHVFNNPEHSLEGLEEFSHVWIFFIFHKNNNIHSKAKVKPPRLNGKKTGVFSTRSPYRPNNIGLTLAKIECLKGPTITVSGIDILDGTPIIDLKPYIPQYDNPALHSEDFNQNQSGDDEAETQSNGDLENQCENDGNENQSSLSCTQSQNEVGKADHCKSAMPGVTHVDCHDKDFELAFCDIQKDSKQVNQGTDTTPSLDGASEQSLDLFHVTDCAQSLDLPPVRGNDVVNQSQNINLSEACRKKEQVADIDCNSSSARCSTASWITKSPVPKLKVRFTPSAEKQLKLFSAEGKHADFKFKFLESYVQAREAISDILHEDPRSTYRRNNCADSLYYFTLDVLHITCWFDEDLVEIVRIKPVGKVDRLKEKQ